MMTQTIYSLDSLERRDVQKHSFVFSLGFLICQKNKRHTESSGGRKLLAIKFNCFCLYLFNGIDNRRGFGNRNRNRDTIENGSSGSTSMSKDDIEKLPCFDFKAKEKGSSSSPPGDCAACLENFKVGDKCRLLPLCKHSFHAQCVDLWLLKTPICPICRASADSWKGGSVVGRVEGHSHFSGTGVRVRESQTTDNASLSDEIAMVELSDEDQTAGNENLVLN